MNPSNGRLRHHTLPVTAFAQNCSLLWCDETRAAAVIDPGGDLPRIEQAAAERRLRLEQIWLTHGHIDHAGGAGELASRLGLPIIGPHAADAYWIDGLAEQSRMFGFPPARPFTPARWLQDGDEVQIGQCALQVRHCPGHTPGHVIFYSAQARLAFVGDVLFVGSVGRTDFPGGSHEQLMRSIDERLLPLGDETVFIPGHGPAGTLGQERVSNPFLQRR